MREQLDTFIKSLKEDRKVISYDEAATKQAIILQLLSILKWNTYNTDEVTPEYSVGGGNVDYSLRVGGLNKVFIEVKRVGEELENHQEQLLNYSFQEGVKLAILNNGRTWWFYLPLHEGSWEQRRFYTIDILEQETEEVVSKFSDFLSKDNVASGQAVQNAEEVYKSHRKETISKDTLPKAWNKIIQDTDEVLIDLVSETTERLCGYKPNAEMIGRFIAENSNRLLIPVSPPTRTARPVSPKAAHRAVSIPMSYTGKSISAFYFRNIKHEVRSWIDLLRQLVNILYASHSADFEKVLTLRGEERPYFTHKPDELRHPQKIGNTNVSFETNLSANLIVKICFDLLAIFGYSDKDLRIEVH